MKSLDEIEVGRKVRIVKILGGYGLVRRLVSLGLTIGVELFIINNQGPIIIKLGDSNIAIGKGIARKVLVEEII
jgi:ferrous iron transport protein A